MHVVGAGLAGLAAAVVVARQGRRVGLYEASPQAGGRCRSFFDAELGCRIDNGNHLLLAGNEAAMSYLRMIDALDTLEGPEAAVLPFVDLATGERWTVMPSRGRIPWWVLRAARRIPGTRARDYLAAGRLRNASEDATVAAVLDPATVLYRRLWQPFAVAALNTSAEQGSARLFGRVVGETLGRGGAACRPLVPRAGLSESLVDPALAALRRHAADIHLGMRLRAIEFAGDRVAALAFDSGRMGVAPEDRVVLAVSAPVAARLAPGLVVPEDHAPIVNAHFRYVAAGTTPLFAGIVNGTAEWVFRKREVLSVTVSAADALIDRPAEELRETLWREIAPVYGAAAGPIPPSRIIKERRATFRATPAQLRLRPPTETRWANLALAGDYVDTGLPATIEGAIRSGFAAAGWVERDGAGTGA